MCWLKCSYGGGWGVGVGGGGWVGFGVCRL